MDKILPEGLRFNFKEGSNGTFDERVLSVKRSKYLDGYWQSEKYFDAIKDQIRADFTLKQPLSAEDQMLADEMNANPRSVSVHIRRGDYVSDYRIISRHYICTPDYYAETMQWMKEKLGKGVVFYIFSDDPDWCRNRNGISIRFQDHIWQTAAIKPRNGVDEPLPECDHG